MQDRGGAGSGGGEGRLPDVPGAAVEALLADGVHAFVLRRSCSPAGVAGVECDVCAGHFVLWGVHELWTRWRVGAAREVAWVPCDHVGGGS